MTITNPVAKAFFAASVLAAASIVTWRATGLFPRFFEPDTDILALIGLGILGYFAFDKQPA